MSEVLSHTNDLLLAALRHETGCPVSLAHQGRGRMVTAIHLPGTEVWVTRDEDWIVGFYKVSDPDDDGICVSLNTTTMEREDPVAVARKVARLLSFYSG